jgi:hypothetical protein
MSELKWLKKDIDVESFYDSVQELISSRSALDKQFMNEMFSEAQEKVDEYVAQHKQDKCDPYNPTIYVKNHFEPFFWMIGLMSLSWLAVDLRKKTINGHCNNPNHNLIGGYPYCKIGSEFHKAFYESVFNTLKQLEDFVYENTPAPIEGKISTGSTKASLLGPRSTGHSWSHVNVDKEQPKV